MHKSIISLVLTSLLSYGAWAEELKLKSDAPDQYVVQKGDTLWGISSKYLNQPWRWTELWGANKDKIRNPDAIYPGDVLVITLHDGKPMARVLRKTRATKGRLPLVVKHPETRITDLSNKPLPTIPSTTIEPFLTQSMVIEKDALKTSPHVIRGPDERLYTSHHQRIYVVNIPQPKTGTVYQVFKQGEALLDPELPKEDEKNVLGYEAEFLGEAVLERTGEVNTLLVTKSVGEISKGDYLVPAPKEQIITYMPHAPEKPMTGKIMKIYGGSYEAGRNSVVLINRGSLQGMEHGHVLASYRAGELITEKPEERTRPQADLAPEIKGKVWKIPDERSGTLFVFRVFGNVSYALVMDGSLPIVVGDEVKNP